MNDNTRIVSEIVLMLTLFVTQITFFVLKIFKIVSWSWAVVFAPLIAIGVIATIFTLIAIIIAVIAYKNSDY